jgi:alpha-N-acetylglucosaminidase
VATLFAEECIDLFGTDHFYNTDPYPECEVGSTPEEKQRIKVDFATTTSEALLAADPKATWVGSGWAFMEWTKQDVAAFLSPIPSDRYIVNDIWAEANPLYRKFGYFSGKQWGFGVLHSMGGWTTLHGDLGDLIARVQAVSNDPAAKNCVNSYLNPEIIHHNDVYFDLAARLAWNPSNVNVDRYLDDYCARRYARDACPGMRKAWSELLQSVYGHYDYTRPLYWDRPLFGKAPKSIAKLRRFYIPHLECALKLALAEAHDLEGNPFYLRDIVDITRQYAAEIYNVHMVELNAAFRAKDRDAFDRHARMLARCLDSTEKILSSHEAFYLASEIKMARRLPLCRDSYFYSAAKDNGEIVRQRYTALGGVKTTTLLDYAAKDMYELVKLYYRKRSDVYVQHLRRKLAAGQDVSTEELEAAYRKIVAEFVATPFEDYAIPSSPYLGKTVSAAREILDNLSCD